MFFNVHTSYWLLVKYLQPNSSNDLPDLGGAAHYKNCLNKTHGVLCVPYRKSTESLQQQQSSRSAGQFSRTPPNPLAALDRAVRRACRLVMDQLLLDLKPYLPGLLTRPWMVQGDPTPKLCRVLEHHLDLYGRVRPPCRQVTTWLGFCPHCRDAVLVIQTQCVSVVL